MAKKKEWLYHVTYHRVEVRDAYQTDAGSKIIVGRDEDGRDHKLLLEPQYWVSDEATVCSLFVLLSKDHKRRVMLELAKARRLDLEKQHREGRISSAILHESDKIEQDEMAALETEAAA